MGEKDTKGVSLLTVFLIAGAMNGVSLFLFDSLHAAKQKDYAEFEGTWTEKLTHKFKYIQDQLKLTPTEKQVQNLGQITAKNTKSIESLKADLGGLKLPQLQKDLVAQQSNSNSKFSDFEAKIKTLTKNVDSFKKEVNTELLTKAQDTRADLYKIVEDIKTKQTKLGEKIEQKIGKNIESGTAFHANIEDLTSGLENLSKSIENLEKENQNIEERIDPVIEKITTIESNIYDAGSELEKMKVELGKRIGGLETEFNLLKSTNEQISLIQLAIDKLKNENTAEISKMRKDLESNVLLSESSAENVEALKESVDAVRQLVNDLEKESSTGNVPEVQTEEK